MVKLGIKQLIGRENGGAKPFAQKGVGNKLRTNALVPVVQKNTIPVNAVAALFFHKGIDAAALGRRQPLNLAHTSSAGVAKFPSVAALQAEYVALQEQKEALYAEYGKLKKQVKEYDVIKRNIDSLLRQDREPERGKETERG